MKGKHNKDFINIKCFNYGEMGHFSVKCLMKKKQADAEKEKGKKVTGVATSGASKHMIGS